MLLCSPISISLAGTSLLTRDADWVLSLPEFSMALEGEDFGFVRAAYKEPTNRGAQTNTVTFNRVVKAEDLNDAASVLMAFEASTPKSGALVISGSTATETYPFARLQHASAVPSLHNAFWIHQSFTIIYGAAE